MDDPTECSKFAVIDYFIEHVKTVGSIKSSEIALFMELSELLLKASDGHEYYIHSEQKLTYTEIRFVAVPSLLNISHEDNKIILVMLLSYSLLALRNSNKKYKQKFPNKNARSMCRM